MPPAYSSMITVTERAKEQHGPTKFRNVRRMTGRHCYAIVK